MVEYASQGEHRHQRELTKRLRTVKMFRPARASSYSLSRAPQQRALGSQTGAFLPLGQRCDAADTLQIGAAWRLIFYFDVKALLEGDDFSRLVLITRSQDANASWCHDSVCSERGWKQPSGATHVNLMSIKMSEVPVPQNTVSSHSSLLSETVLSRRSIFRRPSSKDTCFFQGIVMIITEHDEHLINLTSCIR